MVCCRFLSNHEVRVMHAFFPSFRLRFRSKEALYQKEGAHTLWLIEFTSLALIVILASQSKINGLDLSLFQLPNLSRISHFFFLPSLALRTIRHQNLWCFHIRHLNPSFHILLLFILHMKSHDSIQMKDPYQIMQCLMMAILLLTLPFPTHVSKFDQLSYF